MANERTRMTVEAYSEDAGEHTIYSASEKGEVLIVLYREATGEVYFNGVGDSTLMAQVLLRALQRVSKDVPGFGIYQVGGSE